MIVKRNNFIDILRVVCVIIVFIYHLGYIEAGFLAVCCFFTISGYLFSKTINSNNFNLKIYYLKRLKALYLPLVIVTLLTVITFRYFIDIPWVTIKQETLSVLLGYNNFYQIKANSNYFMRSDASPFTHMWYIAVLIQIEFIFPLIALMFKKTSLKFKKTLLIIITILSTSAFVIINNIYGFAFNYYHTLSRFFHS